MKGLYFGLVSEYNGKNDRRFGQERRHKMDLKRDIYARLLQWKKSSSGKVLEVSGARQVGKTYILTKFAKENYKNYIYILI